ncbi:MAG: hypothetical protein D6780_06410, partial [Candidatus Dadabacteria bacterium]
MFFSKGRQKLCAAVLSAPAKKQVLEEARDFFRDFDLVFLGDPFKGYLKPGSNFCGYSGRQRANFLKRALEASDLSLIFSARGGYGTTETVINYLNELNLSALRSRLRKNKT